MSASTNPGLCPDGQPHAWERTYDERGFPKSCACTRCDASAPEPFCRTPQTCHLAHRYLSEIACNE